MSTLNFKPNVFRPGNDFCLRVNIESEVFQYTFKSQLIKGYYYFNGYEIFDSNFLLSNYSTVSYTLPSHLTLSTSSNVIISLINEADSNCNINVNVDNELCSYGNICNSAIAPNSMVSCNVFKRGSQSKFICIEFRPVSSSNNCNLVQSTIEKGTFKSVYYNGNSIRFSQESHRLPDRSEQSRESNNENHQRQSQIINQQTKEKRDL